MIRFQRIGRRNDAAFRIVVIEKTRGPKAGKYTDLVGSYNPKTKAVSLDGERIKKWIANGAQVSPSLNNLLITQGVLTGKKVNVLPRKHPLKSEKSTDGADSAAAGAEVPVATEETATAAETEATEEAPTAAEKVSAPTEEAPAEKPVPETPQEQEVTKEVPQEQEIPKEAESEVPATAVAPA